MNYIYEAETESIDPKRDKTNAGISNHTPSQAIKPEQNESNKIDKTKVSGPLFALVLAGESAPVMSDFAPLHSCTRPRPRLRRQARKPSTPLYGVLV
jgi:hypothetical protein